MTRKKISAHLRKPNALEAVRSKASKLDRATVL